MEQHRANPACAACHKVMDPIGFSLENFDAIGALAHQRSAAPRSTPPAQLADGTKINGAVGLLQILTARPEQFVRTMTQMLMTYALGRGIEYYDMPVVRGIARDAAKQNYRFSALVLGIIKSPPFQMTVTRSVDAEAIPPAGQPGPPPWPPPPVRSISKRCINRSN